MSLLKAVISAGPYPVGEPKQAAKKRYSELLSKYLAVEVAEGLREAGFPGVKPLQGGPGERPFQGGLGPKKVDVSYADERHGLLLAVSIKTICFPPYGKNLKNRFSDLCTEAITLHLRFPYSVVCMLFAFPSQANEDITPGRPLSTFQKAAKLFTTIGGRKEYTDPGEKFENVTMLLFHPMMEGGPPPAVRLIDAETGKDVEEADYFSQLRKIYNRRNPHHLIGEEPLDDDSEE